MLKIFIQTFSVIYFGVILNIMPIMAYANDRTHHVKDSQDNETSIVYDSPQSDNTITIPNEPLPKSDVQRFVTAIALIRHYYIKDPKTQKLFNDAIRGMVANLDPHSSYLDESDLKELQTNISGQFVGIGVKLSIAKNGLLRVISPLDGSPAQAAGIKPGDYIIRVNKKLVRNLGVQKTLDKIKGNKSTPVTITILRPGQNKPIEKTITRKTIHLTNIKSKLLKPGYAYVRIAFFEGPLGKQLRKVIVNLKEKSHGHLKGLILDLRNNPGGLLDSSAEIANSFLDAKKLNQYNKYIVYTKGRVPSTDMHISATKGDIIPEVPMVVLINTGSASASEIVAGALQDYHRAIIMGTRSFGKGSVQTVLPLSNKEAIKLTTALYYTPAGREIQAQGIEPNIYVPEVNDSEDSMGVTIDEANFQNHLLNNQKNKKTHKTNKIKDNIDYSQNALSLAHSDYQLYQALLQLENLSANKQPPCEPKSTTREAP